jgi:L-threonylcarbamoyladenylate synthase
LVLPAKKTVSNVVRGGQSTVALRVPNHLIALKLLQDSGLALAAPSANKFTQLSPTSATHVTAGLGDAVPVLDGGLCKVGIESTIVSVDDDNWQLLRLGMISEQSIEAVAGKSALKSTQNAPKVPGQHKLHYSPITPIQLCGSRKELLYYVEIIQQSCAALLIGEGEHPSCQFVQLNANANDVAEKLYASLHALDALKVQKLFIEAPPNQEEWLAILDRLNRAAFNQ